MSVPRILDRYVLRFFWSSYFICLVTVALLFVIFDSFDKLPRFFAKGNVWWREIPRYFAGQLPLIFDRFSSFVVLAGAMFGAARLERNNEILPMKAGGVSIYRALAPILFSAVALGGAAALNTELAIPRLADLIRASMSYEKRNEVHPGILKDAAGNTLVAGTYEPAERRLVGVSFREFDERGHEARAYFGERATWIATRRDRGYWLLEDGLRRDYAAPTAAEPGAAPRIAQERIGGGVPKDLAAPRPDEGWPITTTIRPIDIESLGERISLLSFGDLRDQYKRQNYLPRLRVQLHTRLAAPLVPLILCLIGLPFVLGTTGRRGIFLGLLALVVICATYFIMGFVFLELGADGIIPPIWAAWTPTIVFGVAGIVLFDRVRT